MVSTAAFHARVWGSVPGLGGLKETKLSLPHPRVKVSIVGSLRDREVACSVSDRQGSNFESCVWRTVSSQSSHHPQEVLLAQFSLYVHKSGLKPDSSHLSMCRITYKTTSFVFYKGFQRLVFLYKCIQNFIDIDIRHILSLYNADTSSTRLGQQVLPVRSVRFNSELARLFFSIRVVKMGNIMPNTIKQINCRNRFVKPF